jgi:hypothetical protein
MIGRLRMTTCRNRGPYTSSFHFKGGRKSHGARRSRSGALNHSGLNYPEIKASFRKTFSEFHDICMDCLLCYDRP